MPAKITSLRTNTDAFFDSIPKKTFDESAHTILEICETTGISRTRIYAMRKQKMKEGEWEEVWKKAGGRPVKAYRLRRG